MAKYPDFQRESELNRGQFIEFESLLSGHLLSTQGDRVGMANAVETRSPFLDKDLVNYVRHFNPTTFFNSEYGEKAILKEAYKGRIPQNILGRQKYPYRAPVNYCGSNNNSLLYGVNISIV